MSDNQYKVLVNTSTLMQGGGLQVAAAFILHALQDSVADSWQFLVSKGVARELRGFDNLYYEVCNEPYFGGVTMAWQHRIVDTIVRAERDFPARHLISMNIALSSR